MRRVNVEQLIAKAQRHQKKIDDENLTRMEQALAE